MPAIKIIVNARADETRLPEDPTKTVGIRNRWAADYKRRFRVLAQRVRKLLLKGDAGGIPVPFVNPTTLAINQDFEYTNDALSTARFMAWLQLQIDQVLFTNDAAPADIWQNKYINQSYDRGIKRTQADLRRQGVTSAQLLNVTAAEIVGTATATLGGAGTASPIHLEAIRTLYLRSYSDLKGVTDEMAKQMRRVLVEGIEQGLGVRDIARGLVDRVDKIGNTRARLIARTETVRSYNVSTISEFSEFTQRVGIEEQFEWITAGDSRVRDRHIERNGKIYTAAEAQRLIGEPNCRCSLKPHFDKSLLEAQKPT